ncbi:hypothetical protein LTR13_008255 [Exophiala sideris]|nr:hypothetical protein LTR13_008255 [Exophiala sideris]KAK5178302.1 hypothetical protein LTR44_009177 [Eurotiomycetes sp. CCFEE 6388]
MRSTIHTGTMPDLDESSPVLRATYQSQTGSKDFQHVIPTPPNHGTKSLDVQAKTKYLSDLRASSKKLQEDINKFLTEKMEEDKRAQGPVNTNGASKQKAEDELEEETYGEEVPEDDS